MTAEHEITRAADTFRTIFGRPATIAEALEAADDYLDGLIEHAGVNGYMDPGAGAVSTAFVLMTVRAARAAAAEAHAEAERWRKVAAERQAALDWWASTEPETDEVAAAVEQFTRHPSAEAAREVGRAIIRARRAEAELTDTLEVDPADAPAADDEIVEAMAAAWLDDRP